MRAPIHDATTFVYDVSVIPIDKEFSDGERELRAHGELLVIVITAAPHGFYLVHDSRAVFIAPFLALLDERLTPDLSAIDALISKMFVNLGLSCNSSEIGAQYPSGLIALHPCTPDARILDGVVKRMPQMENSCDVRRRNDDRIALISMFA